MFRSTTLAALLLLFSVCAARGFGQAGQIEPAKATSNQNIVPQTMPPKAAPPAGPLKNSETVVLPENTPVTLRVMQSLSSMSSKVGDKVDFEAREDVKIGDQIVIQRGAIASGTITLAEARGRGGKRGKLGIALQQVVLVTGQKATLTGIQGKKGAGSEQTAGKTLANIGEAGEAGILLAPIYFPLVMIFRRGEDVHLDKGETLTAVTKEALTLDGAALAAANQSLQNERQAEAEKLRLQQMAADEARKKQEAADREAAMARKQAAAARIDASYAMLVIYRELKWIDADAQSLYIDQQEIGALKRGCFVGLNLAPGHHNLVTGENIQPLDLLGGHQYWIEMKIEGEYTFRASLVAVDGQTAIHEAALRSPMNPHKIKLPRSAHLLSAGDIQLLQDLYADVK